MYYILQLWENYHFHTSNTNPPQKKHPGTIAMDYSRPFLGANIALPQVLKKAIFIRNGLKIQLFGMGEGGISAQNSFFFKKECIYPKKYHHAPNVLNRTKR